MDRKSLVRDYKQRPRPMGVYRVLNAAEQRSLVAASVDAPAAINRDRFQLRAGLHQNAPLQADWNRLGEEAFAFEILDSVDAGERSDQERTDDLAVLEHLWLEKLSPYGARGYNTGRRPSQSDPPGR